MELETALKKSTEATRSYRSMESYMKLRAAERENWSPPGTRTHPAAQPQMLSPGHRYIKAMLGGLSGLYIQMYTHTYGMVRQ